MRRLYVPLPILWWPEDLVCVARCCRMLQDRGICPAELQTVCKLLQSAAVLSQSADLAPDNMQAEMNRSKDERSAPKTLLRLESLPQQPPPSNTGKVIWAWPKIVNALNAGWRLSQIWEALREDGIEMPYNQFRVYVSRIRRRKLTVAPQPVSPPTDAQTPAEPTASDPYSGIRKQRNLKHRSGFEYDPFSTDKDLLE